MGDSGEDGGRCSRGVFVRAERGPCSYLDAGSGAVTGAAALRCADHIGCFPGDWILPNFSLPNPEWGCAVAA